MSFLVNHSFECEMFQRDHKTAQMGKEILPFEMGYLPDFFQRKAEFELNETPENRRKALKKLKEFIEEDKHARNVNFDDDFLVQYLRCKKYNPKRAFSQLKGFVHLRKHQVAAFTGFDFEKTSICTRNNIVQFLPYRCQDGCAIALIKLDNWIPEEFPIEEVKRMVSLYLLQSMRDPMTQVNGYKAIFDVASNPIRHIRFCTPSNIYLLYYGILECSPGRFKEIHIVNNSLTFKAAWTLIKIFLSSKIKSRFHLHNAAEELLDYFPASVLPAEYGGELKDYDMTPWLKDVMSPEKLATIPSVKTTNS